MLEDEGGRDKFEGVIGGNVEWEGAWGYEDRAGVRVGVKDGAEARVDGAE